MYYPSARDSFLGLYNYWRIQALSGNHGEFFVLDCTFFAQSSSEIMRRSKSLSFTGQRKTLGMTPRHLKSAGTV